MNSTKSIFRTGLFAASLFFFTSCEKIPTTVDDPNLQDADLLAARYGGGGGTGESVGNNLSFPVIWAEGQKLTLREPPAGYDTNSVVKKGAWWYVWGVDPIDPSSPIYSCQPTPAGGTTCIDGTVPGDGSSDVYKAYLQKDVGNYWQARTLTVTPSSPVPSPDTYVNVDWIDWGDNLESSDWSLSSKVRTEVVLTEDLDLLTGVTQYAMRHVSGWGVDEVHGLQTATNDDVKLGTGLQATVYSKHARLTIQRLYETPTTLEWNQSTHSWDGAYEPVFNKAVWQAADGPGYYNAEVNVKGKVIFGYTWDVNKLNSGAGEYRITFSFDGAEAGSPLNTFFVDGITNFVVPEITAEAEEGGGNTPIIVAEKNLTYIDVTITGRGKGGGKK